MSGKKLENAIYLHNHDLAKEIIKAGHDPNDVTGMQMPALIWASCTDNIELVQFLLDAGANPNLATSDHKTALKSAVLHGRVEIAHLLLDAGADPNYERSGEVALTMACDCDAIKLNFDLVQRLFPITAERYHQQAYNYCLHPKLRKWMSEHYNINTDEPIDGFGGPNYWDLEQYSRMPINRTLRQVYILLDKYCENDPNRGFMVAIERLNFHNPDQYFPDGKLQFSYERESMLCDALIVMFENPEEFKISPTDYLPEVQEAVKHISQIVSEYDGPISMSTIKTF